MRLGPLIGAALLLASGCSGGDPGTTPATPARLSLATAPAAEALSGELLSPQPVVQVLDGAGAPIAARGVLVTATLASGGGTLEGATGIRTDQDGRAVFTDLAILGAVGPRTLRFSATGLASAVSGSIALGPGVPAAAVVSSGNNQTVAAGTAVPVAPAVRVADRSDNPVPGVAVTFAVSQGGGTVTGGNAVTDASGLATLGQWVLGTAVGVNALTVTVVGVTGPLTVSATAVVGPAARIVVFEGDGQSATIGAPVSVAPAVKVTDAAGNVVAGVAVTFTANAGGTVSGGTAISDAGGLARAGAWRMGLTPGANSLTAARQGATSAVFTATATDLQASAIAAGTTHGCAVTQTGLRCWGDNTNGQFGDGTLTSDSVATAAAGALVFTEVSAGGGHTCGLTAAGAAWCWGANNTGQLGDGSLVRRTSPVPVAGGYSFRQISAGANHTCALRTDGAAYCWGAGGNGRLGNGGTATSQVPAAVSGGFTWTTIQAGGSHTCAVRNDALVHCWGSNASGRLGDGTTTDRPTPTAVSGGGAWTTVSTGGAHTCGLKQDGQALCWGLGTSGQLGGGAAVAQSTAPTAVSGTQLFSSLTAGFAHSCGLTTAGTAWCWGNNGSGRLGDATTTQRTAPTAVAGGAAFTALSAGSEHTCARSTAGSAICWGRNAEGQVGDGTTAARSSPVGVKQP